ncbi:MAG: MBL fold metallo-hydrolase [Acidobacteria bacterium]|nr:MBL fold metallo-hydrolase [Acidobacteriota bacterium]
MILEVRAGAPFFENGCVVGCERTREAVIIDPGDEAAGLLAAVRDHGLDVRYILLTHAHLDHITGVALMKDALDAPVHLHADDRPLYEHAVEQGEMFGLPVAQPPPVDAYYDMSRMYFGDYEVAVHHTPGHSPGGVCLEIRKKGDSRADLFVGDTLFAGSVGRTDLPGGSHSVLMESITNVLFPLGDAATVHPGHGPDTTIGHERQTNPFVLEYLSGRAHSD